MTRLRAVCFSVALADLAVVAPSGVPALASPASATPSSTSASAAAKPADPERSAGIFYGYIEHISDDRRLIGVSPYQTKGRGAPFVLDRQTTFRRDKKKSSLDELTIGQKVAVRYFAEDSIAVAEAVYLVSGEFVPDDYRKPRRKQGGAPAARAAH